MSVGELTGVEIFEPANRFDLPRLVTHPYRLYPIERQIADKACATLANYSGKPSSREKDLVDLVTIATTQFVDAETLRRSIAQEAALRRLGTIRVFAIPAQWGRAYEQAAKSVPACMGYERVGQAEEFMDVLLGPELLQGRSPGSWSPSLRAWQWTAPPAPNARERA